MKKMLALLMLLVFTSPIFAQDDELDGFSFDTEPLKTEKSPYFAIGAGYTYSFLFMNYDDLNKYVTAFDPNLDKFEGPFYLSGIHGFTGLVIIPNLRLGFYGISGSKLTEKDIEDPIAGNFKRSAELSVSLNGFSLDYGFVPFSSFAILPGVNFGWGTYQVESFEAPSSVDWKDVNTANTKMNRFENSIMFVEPQVNFEYAVTNFAMFRLSVSYNMTFDSFLADKKWLLNNNAELKDVPTGMNSNGLKAQIGIYLGLFNY